MGETGGQVGWSGARSGGGWRACRKVRGKEVFAVVVSGRGGFRGFGSGGVDLLKVTGIYAEIKPLHKYFAE